MEVPRVESGLIIVREVLDRPHHNINVAAFLHGSRLAKKYFTPETPEDEVAILEDSSKQNQFLGDMDYMLNGRYSVRILDIDLVRLKFGWDDQNLRRDILVCVESGKYAPASIHRFYRYALHEMRMYKNILGQYLDVKNW